MNANRPRRQHGIKDWRGALAALQGAYSPATIRAYKADFGAFETWCQSVDLKPLPARPSTVAWLIGVDAERSAASTLNRLFSVMRQPRSTLWLDTPLPD